MPDWGRLPWITRTLSPRVTVMTLDQTNTIIREACAHAAALAVKPIRVAALGVIAPEGILPAAGSVIAADAHGIILQAVELAAKPPTETRLAPSPAFRR